MNYKRKINYAIATILNADPELQCTIKTTIKCACYSEYTGDSTEVVRITAHRKINDPHFINGQPLIETVSKDYHSIHSIIGALCKIDVPNGDYPEVQIEDSEADCHFGRSHSTNLNYYAQRVSLHP